MVESAAHLVGHDFPNSSDRDWVTGSFGVAACFAISQQPRSRPVQKHEREQSDSARAAYDCPTPLIQAGNSGEGHQFERPRHTSPHGSRTDLAPRPRVGSA